MPRISWKLQCFGGVLLLFAVWSAHAQTPLSDWSKYYYKNPQPERFVAEVRARIEAGDFKEKNKGLHPGMTAFYGQIMAQNPDKIESWLTELKATESPELDLLFFSAWLSDTEQARDYFKKNNLNQYLKNRSAGVLESKLDTPVILSALWGSFKATGDIAYVRKIVSGLDHEKHLAAVEKLGNRKPTDEEKPHLRLGMIFRSVKSSLESNCETHPLVLEHCEKIFAETPRTNDNAARIKNLGTILAKFKPDKYKPSDLKRP